MFETWRKALDGPEPCIEIEVNEGGGFIPAGVRPQALDVGVGEFGCRFDEQATLVA